MISLLLKAEGRFAALPVVASRAMRLGSTVATVGFPNPAVAGQGFAPKLARGDIAALSAPTSDVGGYFQISVPVQPALEFKLQLARAAGNTLKRGLQP